MHLLEVKKLTAEFRLEEGTLKAVNGVSYYVDKGEIVAFVGESGSGKSVTQYSALGLIPIPPAKIVSGEILYKGDDLLLYGQNSRQLQEARGGQIGIVFQEPMTSLNPVMTVGDQIRESVTLHLGYSRDKARSHCVDLLKKVGIPDPETRIDDFPHQFSGGMRQRIMIAMALSCGPKILIADEATTALDVTTQAQILELLRNLVRETETSMVMVTHNLSIVARYADRIYVMYAGEIVESGSTQDVFKNPRHPYTIGLLRAVPSLNDPKDRVLVPIEGFALNLLNKPNCCAFATRCIYAEESCFTLPSPVLQEVKEDGIIHQTACHCEITRDTVSKKNIEQTKRNLKKAESASQTQDKNIILDVKNLKVYFPIRKGFFRRKVGDLEAVDDVSFQVQRGETFGLVGESGCGKTTVARAVMRLSKPRAGQIVLNGLDIVDMDDRALLPLRRDMSMIFQDPYGSLDPRQLAGKIVGEPLRNFKLCASAEEYQRRIKELFELVGLDPAMSGRMPHEFSGGQRQRLGIARALATHPSFIVCDEAISALDVSIQAQIINLLEELQAKIGLTYLFIAHDLSVVKHISDHVAVMYLGRIVEMADWKSLYENPLHPYTKVLLDAIPVPDPELEAKRDYSVIKGEVPSLLNKPQGCGFSNRCSQKCKECTETVPQLKEKTGGHWVACNVV